MEYYLQQTEKWRPSRSGRRGVFPNAIVSSQQGRELIGAPASDHLRSFSLLIFAATTPCGLMEKRPFPQSPISSRYFTCLSAFDYPTSANTDRLDVAATCCMHAVLVSMFHSRNAFLACTVYRPLTVGESAHPPHLQTHGRCTLRTLIELREIIGLSNVRVTP